MKDQVTKEYYMTEESVLTMQFESWMASLVRPLKFYF